MSVTATKPGPQKIAFDSLAFCTKIAALWRTARASGRGFLTYGEWGTFARAAVDTGIITIEELQNVADLRERNLQRAPPVNEMLPVMRRNVIESLGRVKAAKTAGLSASALSESWNADIDAIDAARRREQERAAEDKALRDAEAVQTDRKGRRVTFRSRAAI
jgi:hypothetical protein